MMKEPESTAAPPQEPNKARHKLQAAWISFVSRIIAQMVGAAASVTLGILMLQGYQAAPPQQPAHESQSPSIVRASNHGADGTVALAVLPLDSFSPDPSEAYFAGGMTEALIAHLTQIDGLRVISRTSTMRYGAERKSLPEIAQELDVDLIIEGSVVKTGDRVRVTAQLIDAQTDEHVWARSYDRRLADVLTLQAEVAKTIAEELKGALLSVE
jgi:TolB-like protein